MDIIKINNKNVLRVTAQDLAKINKKADGEQVTPPGDMPSFDAFFSGNLPDPYEYFTAIIRPMKDEKAIEQGINYMNRVVGPEEMQSRVLAGLQEELQAKLTNGEIDKARYDKVLGFWTSKLAAAPQAAAPAAPTKAPWGELHTDVQDIQGGDPFEMEFSSTGDSRRIQDEIMDHMNKQRKDIMSHPIPEEEKKRMLQQLDLRQKEMMTEFAKAMIRTVLANGKQSLRLNKLAWQLIGLKQGWITEAQSAPVAPPTTRPTTKPTQKPSKTPDDPMKPRPAKVPQPAKAKKLDVKPEGK